MNGLLWLGCAWIAAAALIAVAAVLVRIMGGE